MQGSSKEKVKKAASCNTEISIVVATPSQMVFPHNEAVVNATHKKRKRKSCSSSGAKKSKGAATTSTSSSGLNSVSNTSSSIGHNTSIMTANAKAHSIFLPQGL